MPTAYIDESFRDGAFGRRYLLAATIPFRADVTDYRRAMAELLPEGQKKVRWYNSVDPLKKSVMSTIAAFDVMHCVVTRQMTANEEPEQARKKCLTMLAYEISTFDVADAIFEARSPKLDNDDIKMLNYLRTSKTIPHAFTGTHRPGRDEPMLWIPDAICGAVAESWSGVGYLAAVEQQVHQISDLG